LFLLGVAVAGRASHLAIALMLSQTGGASLERQRRF
jgi:hypothetical protein